MAKTPENERLDPTAIDAPADRPVYFKGWKARGLTGSTWSGRWSYS